MSNQLHDGESDRRRQVKFRADAELVERFDEMVAQNDEYSSRTDALVSIMRRELGAADEQRAPLNPPAEEQLRRAYLNLVQLSNYAGIIPHQIATNELSCQIAMSQKIIERRILGKLRDRGYIRQLTNIQGTERAWKLRGYDS